MNIVKQFGMAVAVLASSVVIAGEESGKQYVEAYQGDPVVGEWHYWTNAPKTFMRKGNIGEGKSLHFSSDTAKDDSHASIFKYVDALPYRKQRVQATFKVRMKDVSESLMLDFGVYDQQESQKKNLAWDSTYTDPVSGSLDWTEKTMILDVPAEADTISIGAGIVGRGSVEISDIRLSVVDKSIPVTDKGIVDRLWEQERFAEFLTELDNWAPGNKLTARYASLQMERYMAMMELGQKTNAEKVLDDLHGLVTSKEWQAKNFSDWGKGMAAEVRFLAGELSDKELLQVVESIPHMDEKRKLRVKKWNYELIGFKHRMDGNLVAAKAAYQKAASREWGDKVDYTIADRQLKKVESAIMASK
ncbi:hypothetical protein [Microbulbifer magnicolonia]|uniref:hypothetical protein n=1 Tax=Microbulbifer magnicolonia TaxID=3109744 RepID=UPI002B416409|nr:hypothetical protein [Microbulbifer sp. GG15]